jgi:hypothetical protein
MVESEASISYELSVSAMRAQEDRRAGNRHHDNPPDLQHRLCHGDQCRSADVLTFPSPDFETGSEIGSMPVRRTRFRGSHATLVLRMDDEETQEGSLANDRSTNMTLPAWWHACHGADQGRE